MAIGDTNNATVSGGLAADAVTVFATASLPVTHYAVSYSYAGGGNFTAAAATRH